MLLPSPCFRVSVGQKQPETTHPTIQKQHPHRFWRLPSPPTTETMRNDEKPPNPPYKSQSHLHVSSHERIFPEPWDPWRGPEDLEYGSVPWWEAHLDNPIHCITVHFKPEASRHQWRHDGGRLKARGANDRIHSTGGEDARTRLGREGPGYKYGT